MSAGGLRLHALLLTKEGVRTPAEMANLNRPIVWLIGQQHGNEPAGGEAMLALAKALSDGELTPLLDALSIVIVPRANPDGAAASQRENANGFDINRDHGLLTQPEVKLLHGLVRQVPPALVIDAHEFTVGRRWVEKLGGLQSVDLMVLSATHPMVAPPLKQIADELFQPAIEAAIAPHKLKTFVYHTTSSRAGDRTISVGGNAPGIARNAFGLMGAVSFLIETRGVGIGLESYQRRVATHYIATKALLQAAAAHGPALAATVADANLAQQREGADIVVEHTAARTFVQLPLIDPASGQDRPATVEMLDTRVITGLEQRSRPEAYVVMPSRAGLLADRLALFGVATCTLARQVERAIERYEVVSRHAADRRAINPDRSLKVRVVAGRAVLPASALYIPLDQPAGTRIALALEPDAPGSLSALELAPAADTVSLDIVRIPKASLTPDFTASLRCPNR